VNGGDCQQLVDAYLAWLKRGVSAEPLDGACELTTPFLDRHNDHLQIYAERRNGSIVLSDDGYVLSDLRTSGLELDTPKRREVFQAILNGFGVRSESGELTIEASQRTVGQKVHSLVQAMLAVNDMFTLARPHVASFFLEDVRSFLDEREVRYSERVKVAGRSGFDHLINFLIPPSPNAPERFVQAINAPTRQMVTPYLFGLSDVREARGGDAQAYAFLNDRDREVPGEVAEALEAYSVTPAYWSHRDEHAEALAA